MGANIRAKRATLGNAMLELKAAAGNPWRQLG